jgi:glutathione synthase/RimK-type ligase-like ATP-grasp enzyme
MSPPSRKTKQLRIALATCAAHPRLAPDDRLLAAAIAARGIEPVPVVWNAEGTDWAAFDGCVIRSVWDYHLAPDRFLAWAERVAGTVPTWNPAELIAGNVCKEYLRQLERRGIPVIPTRWLERGSQVSLAGILAAEGWEEAVIKPTVDLGAKNLRRVGGAGGEGQKDLDELLARHDVMAQPFLPSLEARGELSLVYCAGQFSHAVRKLPASGDFRVQPSWGGSSRAADVDRACLELAGQALAGLGASPLYARVDLVEGPRGERLLIELELIDPNLFFAERPEAAAIVAAEIEATLRG